MTNNISCPLAMEGAKIVGSCGGQIPQHGDSSLQILASDYELKFLNNSNKEIDFLVITSFPYQSQVTGSQIQVGVAAVEPMSSIIPVTGEMVNFPLYIQSNASSSSVFTSTTNGMAMFAGYVQNDLVFIQSVATLDRYTWTTPFTITAYKYN